jgi:pimeloyl-ACP methyl ester carboxylesterase
MEHAYVNGVDLEYQVTGSGEPVLLISAVVADGFLPLVSERALAGSYRLITYHKRGWAGSTHTPPPVSIADHSSGAAVALQLAIERPEIVHTLALLELSLLSVPSAAGFLQKAGPAFAAYAAGQHETALATFMSAVSGLEWEACRAVLDEHVPGAIPQGIEDADTFFGVELPALSAWTFGAEQAATISQPVLSVLGTDTEPLWIEVAERLRAWLAHVEECTIEGVGHLLHMQRPEPVAKYMAEFFSRYPLTGN